MEVKFTHFTKVRSVLRPFVSYEMNVQSPSTNPWVIEKRYSEFSVLHRNLRELDPKLRLPSLPPRRVYTIQLFSAYVKELLAIPDILQENSPVSNAILKFLVVPENVRPLLLKSRKKQTGEEWSQSLPNHKYLSRAPNERRVYQLIDELRDGQRRASSIQKFEEYFVSRQKADLKTLSEMQKKFKKVNAAQLGLFHLSKDMIRYLFQGPNNPILIRLSSLRTSSQASRFVSGSRTSSTPDMKASSGHGLIQICGNVGYAITRVHHLSGDDVDFLSKSNVASRAALKLICRLTDYERNRNAATYIDVLKDLGIAILRELNLSDHILSQRGSRLAALRLLLIFQEHLGKPAVEEILNFPTAFTIDYNFGSFSNWVAKENGVSISTNTKESPSTIQNAVNLSDVPRKVLIHEMLKSIHSIAKENNTNLVANSKGILSEMESKESLDKFSKKWVKVHLPIWLKHSSKNGSEHSSTKDYSMIQENSDEDDAPPPPAENTFQEATKDTLETSLEYKCLDGITTLRARTVINFDVNTISELLMDSERCKEWNKRIHKTNVIKRFSDNVALVHEVYKSFSSPYSYRDFSLLRAIEDLPNGGKVIGFQSVSTPLLPEQKGSRRGILLATGYSVEPLEIKDNPAKEYLASAPNMPSVVNSALASRMAKGKASNNGKAKRLPSSPPSSVVTYVAQMTQESSMLATPDLLGERSELIDTFRNINVALQKRPNY
eukprot:jgi/Bigna1/144185/aug1.85_g18893